MKERQAINTGEGMEKRELSHTNGKNLHWYTHFEEIPHVSGQGKAPTRWQEAQDHG